MQKPPKERDSQWQALRFWENWVLVTVIAELVGIGVIAAFTLQMGTANSDTTANTLLLSIGVAEGVILGTAQWFILRHYVDHAMRWIFATAIGTLLGWALGVPISLALMVAHGTIIGQIDPMAILRGIVLLGAGMGLIVGYCQWLVIQNQVPRRSYAWMAASAIAWALGVCVAFLVSNSGMIGAGTIAVAISGAAMGAVIGAITGLALVGLIRSHFR